ncbi:hypothetical protein ADU86_13705, partial [Clostridium botulinum]
IGKFHYYLDVYKCYISKHPLGKFGWHCHHKKPKKLGGTDIFDNLIVLTTDVHKLVHVMDIDKIEELLNKVGLDKKQLKKLNELRVLVKNPVIKVRKAKIII